VPGQHLKPLHIGQSQRQVQQVMAGLRIAGGEAVDQDQHLVEGRSADRQVALHAVLLPLTDDHPGHGLQRLAHRTDGRGRQVGAVEHAHRAHDARQRGRHARTHDLQGFGQPQRVVSGDQEAGLRHRSILGAGTRPAQKAGGREGRGRQEEETPFHA